MNDVTAKTRYDKLEAERRAYTDRAEKNALLTIPMLFPKDSDTSSTDYETPYQSIGARGVNNLASKLLLALFPPNAPFFRLSLGDEVLNIIENKPEAKTQLEEFLAKIERRITGFIETHQLRVTAAEALLQLIVAGNALLFLPPKEGGMRLYRLNKYVVQRDGIGNVLEIVTKDTIAYAALPDEAKSCIQENDVDPDKNYDIYTRTYLEGDVYISYQELEGKIIAGSEQTYPADKSPWIPVRLKKMDGESYGRSFVDEYYGDLKSLEATSKAIAQVSAVASNIIYLVNPNSVLRVTKLKDAKAGDFIKGKKEDITALQLDKTVDLQVTFSFIQQVEGRLSYAFLLNSAVQRDADRVTAEEIRYVANELEDTIGGIYSILSQELQLPLIRRLMTQMTKQGAIPDIPQGAAGIEPKITTGIEALGRGHDLTRLDTFLRYGQAMPEAFAQEVRMSSVLAQIATSLGLNDVMKTEDEKQAEQQQQQEQQLAQQVAPQVARGAMQ